MGLRRIEEQIQKEAAMRVKGAQMAISELEDMITHIKDLHKQLEKLEKKHGRDIKENPDVGKRLMDVRRELGLPPQLGVFDRGKMTQEQIAMQVLDLGRSLMSENGGVMSFAELLTRLNRKYEGLIFAPSDIIKAVDVLKKQKLIVGVRELKSGMRIVEFVDIELSDDTVELMQLAQRNRGELTLDQALIELQWPPNRAKRVFEHLTKKKIAQEQKDLDGVRYYFYGL